MGINVTGSYKYKRPTKKSQTPLLPGDAALIRQLEDERIKRKVAPDRLNNLGPAKLPWQLARGTDLLTILHAILGRQWVDIPEKGISGNAIATVHNFRKALPPLVMVSQIYGVFPHGTTQIDRDINRARREGKVRLLTVNLPNSSDLIIESEAFYAAMGEGPSVDRLKTVLVENPEATWLSMEMLNKGGLSIEDVANLVKQGHLSIDPGNPGVRTITTPLQGAFLKLVTTCRTWLLKVLGSNKWKELPEDLIQEKLDSGKNYWRDLKGVQLEWILYDGIGAGWVDGFKTPIGRGWKVLRSK